MRWNIARCQVRLENPREVEVKALRRKFEIEMRKNWVYSTERR